MADTMPARQSAAAPARPTATWARQRSALLAVTLGSALLLAALAGWLGWRNSAVHYAVAPYHYDAVVYMLRSAELHHQLPVRGQWAIVTQALLMKDSLDVTLRALLWPEALGHRYGHLAVLLPLLAGFLALLIWYVYTRCGSWLAALVAATTLFGFPLVYDPFWGIAVYWKDTLAAWLLGSALLAWLLSGGLARLGWAGLCGLCLGLLVAQRSAAAVYAAVLFAPLVLWAVAALARRDGWGAAVRSAAALALPAVLLGGLVMAMQWQQLYEYYFERGYAYGDPLRVARYLLGGMGYGVVERSVGFFVGIPYGMGYAPPALLLLAAALLALGRRQGRPLHDPLVAGWLVVGLPVLVCLTRTMFHGFFAIWTPLLVVLLGTLIAVLKRPGQGRVALAALLLALLLAGGLQNRVASQRYQPSAQAGPLLRNYYDLIGDILYHGSPQNHYAMVASETIGMVNLVQLRTHMIFNRGLFFKNTLFAPRHLHLDDDLSVQQIVDSVMRPLSTPDTLVVSECDLAAAGQREPNPRMAQVILGLHQYLRDAPQWQAIAQVRLRARCVMIYRYAPAELSPEEKWGSMQTHDLGSP